MKTTLHQPHDKLVKHSLTDKRIAIDFLKSHLPADIFQRLDITTLELCNTSFITPKFHSIHSDIIYRCQIDGKDGYIFFLIEAESTANEELMAFRKLQYSIGVMDQHLKQGHKKLPIVLPICIYHGTQSPYPHKTDVYECFDDPALARQLVFKPFTLIDLTVLSDEDIAKHGLARLMEMLLKHCRSKNFLDPLTNTIAFFQEITQHFNHDYRSFVIKYMIEVMWDETKPYATEGLIDNLMTVFPEEKKTLMTFAQQLRQEGLQQGVQQGLQQGIQQGVQQGLQQGIEQGEYRKAVTIAKTMHSKGLPLDLIKEVTKLPDLKLAELDNNL